MVAALLNYLGVVNLSSYSGVQHLENLDVMHIIAKWLTVWHKEKLAVALMSVQLFMEVTIMYGSPQKLFLLLRFSLSHLFKGCLELWMCFGSD